MISLTKEAAAQVRASALEGGAENMALRIAARVNQAGMLEFGMGFDDERSNDTIVDSWGVTLLVNAESAAMLDDVTVDFSEVSPGEHRFVFMKASAQSGGCSTAASNSGGGCGGCGGGCGS